MKRRIHEKDFSKIDTRSIPRVLRLVKKNTLPSEIKKFAHRSPQPSLPTPI